MVILIAISKHFSITLSLGLHLTEKGSAALLKVDTLPSNITLIYYYGYSSIRTWLQFKIQHLKNFQSSNYLPERCTKAHVKLISFRLMRGEGITYNWLWKTICTSWLKTHFYVSLYYILSVFFIISKFFNLSLIFVVHKWRVTNFCQLPFELPLLFDCCDGDRGPLKLILKCIVYTI